MEKGTAVIARSDGRKGIVALVHDTGQVQVRQAMNVTCTYDGEGQLKPIVKLPVECKFCSCATACYINGADPICGNFDKRIKEDISNEIQV